MDLFSLRNKVAIVTGACGLLGQQHCRALSEAGATVIVTDLDQNRCSEVASQLGEQHFAIRLDVTDPDSLMQARKKILDEYKHIDILVNNAAIDDKFENQSQAITDSMFENYSLERWNQSLSVNITGVFLCSQIFGSIMAIQGSGSIINVASTYGISGPDQRIYQSDTGKQLFYKSPAYPVTKSAVIGFTKYLAAYWGNKNVRVNALSPGGVENNQNESFIRNYSNKTILNRMATPSDYKGAIVFLASDASSYMTGANLIIDGGWTAI